MQKINDGKRLTAADYRFLHEMESEERATATAASVATSELEDEINGGATLEEDLEEWTLRDGVVRGRARRLSLLATAHGVERKEIDKALWKIQRGLLARFGFEGTKRSGPLSGNEALALQWVKSIAQLAKASQEWELQMEDLERGRAGGHGSSMERFAALVTTLKQLAEKRDGLSLKVRELSAREKRVGTGRGQKAHSFQIVIANGEET